MSDKELVYRICTEFLQFSKTIKFMKNIDKNFKILHKR